MFPKENEHIDTKQNFQVLQVVVVLKLPFIRVLLCTKTRIEIWCGRCGNCSWYYYPVIRITRVHCNATENQPAAAHWQRLVRYKKVYLCFMGEIVPRCISWHSRANWDKLCCEIYIIKVMCKRRHLKDPFSYQSIYTIWTTTLYIQSLTWNIWHVFVGRWLHLHKS